MLDLYTKILAVLRIQTPLVAPPGVLVEHVGKTQVVEQPRWRKADEDSPLCRQADDPGDFELSFRRFVLHNLQPKTAI
jgi:hypothetical protein